MGYDNRRGCDSRCCRIGSRRYRKTAQKRKNGLRLGCIALAAAMLLAGCKKDTAAPAPDADAENAQEVDLAELARGERERGALDHGGRR